MENVEYDVSILPCADYDGARVREALIAATDAVGGLDWVTPGMKIAIKANLVTRLKPETAACVHPVAATELCRLLTERGAEVILGDSPGGPWTAAWVNAIYSGTGIRAVEQTGAKLNDDFSQETVDFPAGVRVKSFPFTSWLLKADAVIDLCKLKTHGLTGMTNAVKNFFGSVPGTRKPEFHYLHPQIGDFSNMLIDLNEFIRPRLTIVDAVDCMEGNGPTMGTPRHVGALLAARTPYAADLAAAHILGFTAEQIPTLAAAHERGLAPGRWEELKIYGDLQSFHTPDFKKQPIREDILFREMLPFVNGFLNRNFGTGPKVDTKKCIGCGVCAESCPMKTIAIKKGRARIDPKKCIRCFCCQEFCPKGAISLHRPLLARLVGKRD